MKFKIDENSPFSVKRILETMGDHQVDSVYHEKITGIKDGPLLTLCLKEKRILITLDTDFSNALLHPRGTFYGIILLKSETQGKKVFISLFQDFLNQYPLEKVIDKAEIVEPHKILVRWDCV